jgi:hypothetical protein
MSKTFLESLYVIFLFSKVHTVTYILPFCYCRFAPVRILKKSLPSVRQSLLTRNEIQFHFSLGQTHCGKQLKHLHPHRANKNAFTRSFRPRIYDARWRRHFAAKNQFIYKLSFQPTIKSYGTFSPRDVYCLKPPTRVNARVEKKLFRK